MKLEDISSYKRLTQMYSEDELEYISVRYTELAAQFNNDLLTSEIQEVIDYLSLVVAAQRLAIRIEDLRRQIVKDKQRKSAASSRRIKNNVLQLESLQDKSSAAVNQSHQVLASLKATRGQRVSILKNKNENFLSWCQALYSDNDLMASYGEEMEKMRIAMENEKARLSEYHTYANGEVDQPFLSCDTYKGDDQ